MTEIFQNQPSGRPNCFCFITQFYTLKARFKTKSKSKPFPTGTRTRINYRRQIDTQRDLDYLSSPQVLMRVNACAITHLPQKGKIKRLIL